jgi:hypothetical protein
MPDLGGDSHHPRRPFALVLLLDAFMGDASCACGAGHPVGYRPIIESFRKSKARVAERLIEEGLRIEEELPGIVFRSGPTGRRAGIAGGHDVWEIARDLKAAAGEGATDPIEAVVYQRPRPQRGGTGSELLRRLSSDIDERIQLDEEAAERLRHVLGPHPPDQRREAAARRDVDAGRHEPTTQVTHNKTVNRLTEFRCRDLEA